MLFKTCRNVIHIDSLLQCNEPCKEFIEAFLILTSVVTEDVDFGGTHAGTVGVHVAAWSYKEASPLHLFCPKLTRR